jgi:uncharacterized membrane protein YwaF
VRGDVTPLLSVIGSYIFNDEVSFSVLYFWQVVKIVQLLLSYPDIYSDIGVISPYSAQVTLAVPCPSPKLILMLAPSQAQQ